MSDGGVLFVRGGVEFLEPEPVVDGVAFRVRVDGREFVQEVSTLLWARGGLDRFVREARLAALDRRRAV